MSSSDVMGVLFLAALASPFILTELKKRRNKQESTPPQDANGSGSARKTVSVDAVECAHCSKPFIPVNSQQKYCGDTCRNKAYYKAKK
jgi:hypothetical protein